MLQKYYLATFAMFALACIGCQTPYGGCAGGCCSGTCGVAPAANTGYAPSTQTYASSASAAYAPAQQQSLPPAFGGQGSGSR